VTGAPVSANKASDVKPPIDYPYEPQALAQAFSRSITHISS